MRALAIFFVFSLPVLSETRTLTLKEAVDLALKQNPDLVLARLDEQKAAQTLRIARDPFTPKVSVGSGAAYSSGFPMTIGGRSPAVFEARAFQTVFNRAQSYQIAQTRENARTAALDVNARRDEAALRTASLYLEAERAARMAQAAREQAAALEKVAGSVRARVAEGRELEIENKRAALNLARARARAGQLENDLEYAQDSLANVLGLAPADTVRVMIEDDRAAPPLPGSDAAAVESALANSKEIRRIESALLAKGYEVRAHRAARLPTLDLVAQYGLFGRFNRYDEFFNRFERHNVQVGISFNLPIVAGSAPGAQAAAAELDADRLRTEMNHARGRISAETRRAYQQMQSAQAAADVARLDLEVARDQLSILLAQMGEGRATLRQVEEARFAEQERWLALYDARYTVEQARFELLRHTGDLLAALR